MDLAVLKAFKPSEYQEAADGYRATSEMAGKAREAIDNRVSAGIRNQLSGESATAALRELKELSKDFHYVETECALVSTALNGFAFDMAAAKRKLEAALEDAKAAGCTVGTDGSVTFPAGGKEVDGKVPEGGTVQVSTSPTDPTASALERQAVNMHPNPNFGKAVGFADRIGDALKEATDADTKWAPKLRALKADDDLVVSDKDWIDVKSDTDGVRDAGKGYLDSLPRPPKHDDPKANADWWKGLTDEQRSDYLSVHPDAVGAMDGLPATVRDQANRTVLDEAHAKAQLDYDAWLKKHPEPERFQPYIDPYTGAMPKGLSVETQAWKDWEEARKAARGPLGGMEAIEKRFDTYTDESKRPYLLGFDDTNNGRVIISIGDPDTADNVATYVPGTGTSLSSIDGDIHRAEVLQDRASLTDPTHKTASIMWLGYDAPQDLLTDATDAKYADAAREPLGNFLTGIDTAHHGPVNSTVLGHSYGTLVAGETMRDHPNLPVDRAILVGSPGVGVNHAKDLHIGADHVWAATARNDLVNLAPPPAGPLAPLNPKAYWRLFNDHSVMYGNDPTSDEFGGQTFHVAPGKLPTTDGLMPAHSQYWEGDSLNNMAKIVTGGTP
ncbi:Alpha/beta hydrolase [Streptomyces misionensis]|uniref:Alpha/beta hydrolase n=1 Tax=Streptomyces misionensis TaxID=67331 RepID=A0A1H5ADD8_9ACTN|nr:alpha/beta hydrolase [Streptomyces misionensis]SED39580.1 Alpha/beta hydrolase [Streptomyces misionensis]